MAEYHDMVPTRTWPLELRGCAINPTYDTRWTFEGDAELYEYRRYDARNAVDAMHSWIGECVRRSDALMGGELESATAVWDEGSNKGECVVTLTGIGGYDAVRVTARGFSKNGSVRVLVHGTADPRRARSSWKALKGI